MNHRLRTLVREQKALQDLLRELDQEIDNDPTDTLRNLYKEASAVAKSNHLSTWEKRSSLARLCKARRHQESKLVTRSTNRALHKKRRDVIEKLDVLAREIECQRTRCY